MILAYPISLVNQQLIAYFFGTSKELDLYNMIVAIVNAVGVLFYPMKDALTPYYFKLKNKSLTLANQTLSQVINFYITLMIAVFTCVLLSFLAFPYFWRFLLPSIDIQSHITRLLLYIVGYAIFLSLYYFTFVLQTFLIAYKKPIFQVLQKFYIPFISILFLVSYAKSTGVYTIIIANIVGSLSLCGIQIFSLRKTDIQYTFFTKPKLDKYILSLYSMLMAYYFGNNIFVFLEQWVLLSFKQTGLVSSFQYGYTLAMVPYLLFALPLYSIMYPKILQSVEKNNLLEIGHMFFKYSERIWLLVGFCTLYCFAFSYEIIYIIFAQGNFVFNDVIRTGYIFKYLIVFILLECVQFILVNIFTVMHRISYMFVAISSRIIIGLSLLIIAKLLNNMPLALFSIPIKTLLAIIILYTVFYFKIIEKQDRKKIKQLYIYRLIRILFILAISLVLIQWGLADKLNSNALQAMIANQSILVGKLYILLLLAVGGVAFLFLYLASLFAFHIIKIKDAKQMLATLYRIFNSKFNNKP